MSRGSRLRPILVALGLGAATSGCHSTDIRFPDAGEGHVAFSPDGTTVVVTPPGRILAYELATRRVRWEKPVLLPLSGVSFSPSGTYVVLIDKSAGDRATNVALLRMSDGAQTFTKQLLSSPEAMDRDFYAKRAADCVSASDDGAWIAFALDDGSVEVFSAAGQRAFHDVLQGALEEVAFQAGGHRFYFGSESGAARVVDEVGGTWKALTSFDLALRPSWTMAGLAFGSRSGLELWDGAARRVVLPAKQAFYFAPTPSSRHIWAFSPQGDYVAVWDETRVTVYRVSSGAVVGKTEEKGGGSSPVVVKGVFGAGHFRAFLQSGDFIDLALDGSNRLRRKSFGSPGNYSRNLFNEGASYEANYVGLLGPDGRFLDTFSMSGDGHRIHITE
jgi:hypothetical protein